MNCKVERGRSNLKSFPCILFDTEFKVDLIGFNFSSSLFDSLVKQKLMTKELKSYVGIMSFMGMTQRLMITT
jgi:hypothetical protein